VLVALGIQRARRMRHTAICGLPRATIFFSTLSDKRMDNRTKIIENKKVSFDFLYSSCLEYF